MAGYRLRAWGAGGHIAVDRDSDRLHGPAVQRRYAAKEPARYLCRSDRLEPRARCRVADPGTGIRRARSACRAGEHPGRLATRSQSRRCHRHTGGQAMKSAILAATALSAAMPAFAQTPAPAPVPVAAPAEPVSPSVAPVVDPAAVVPPVVYPPPVRHPPRTTPPPEL